MTMVISGQTIVVDNDDQIIKMKKWCDDNSIIFKFWTEYYGHCCGFSFNNDEDVMAFKLRWI